tara:strand:- start:37 stop:321 length:285 start_codon:yes stop_codon:yes gene_type:complete
MEKIKKNLTKKDISLEISKKLGLSDTYILDVTNDLIDILKKLSKKKTLKIKNFGIFKVLYKKERVGRNPKTKQEYMIPARKIISFVSSKNKVDL